MTPYFVKWLEDRWPSNSEAPRSLNQMLPDAQRKRLDGIIKTTALSPDQQLIWIAALTDLVANRWTASEPRGLATARAAIAFLKTEAEEHQSWWKNLTIRIEDIECYLCTALDDVFDDEENAAIKKSHQLYNENHFDDDDPDGDRQRWAFQDACDDEMKGIVISMIIHARALALAAPAEERT